MLSQSLDGVWSLWQAGTDEKLDAQVPGCVHLDLMSAKKIEDPFWADNEYRVAWVHNSDWVYSRLFQLDDALRSADRVFLECDGLDTLCTVHLNGELLGSTDNMYIPHRFDVTGRLMPGQNDIRMEFRSPVTYSKTLMCDDYKCPGESIPGAVVVRKSPCQWGWDWGPKIPTSGIWRPIRLTGYTLARIDDLRVIQKHSEDSVELDVQVSLEGFRDDVCSLSIRLTHPDGRTEECEATIDGTAVRCTMNVTPPQLWWPNGHGAQPLYTVQAELACDGVVLDTFTRRIGLRTIALDQSPDAHGKKFTFIVNGVSIFCKGADWIPADQFPSRITDEHYRHLISSAARANMNMLRIWGGGIYEDERFYDLCDEYGILVWQDFMFSCSHYPADDAFLGNVRKEVESVAKRLRNRACLALWCGNNEMEQGVCSWWRGEGQEKRQKEYASIFHGAIPETLAVHDPHTPYWPSSPSAGIDDGFQKDPNCQDCGDGHYWDVWHGRRPFTAYREQYHRFMSEFGFESMPCLNTVRSFAPEEELNMTSYVMECHQKNSAGNGLILYYLAQTFRFPKNFEMMCYTSQLLQAEAIRYGVEHWRRNRERCMGTLYWQFNDTWPVASWAGIDYFGRWKGLQYAAKRFYEPVLLSVCEEGSTADIHVTNDTLETVSAELRWSLENFDGSVLRSGTLEVEANAESDTLAVRLDFSEELQGDAKRQAALVCEMFVDGERRSLTMTPFVPSKHLDLPSASLVVQPGRDPDGAYVNVSSNVAARFVCLSLPGQDVIFSDNFFDLPAGRIVTIRVESEVPYESIAGIKAHSLRDTY